LGRKKIEMATRPRLKATDLASWAIEVGVSMKESLTSPAYSWDIEKVNRLYVQGIEAGFIPE